MYDEIDYRFRKEAKELNNRLAFLGLAGIYLIIFIVSLFVFDEHIFDPFYNYIISVVALGVVVLLSIYLLIVVSIRKESSFSWKKIWKVRTIINIYYDTIHEKDIKLLIILLKEFNTNTRPKVQEALRHYQCQLPRRIAGQNFLISLVALTVSLIALFIQDRIMESPVNVAVAIAIIAGVIIIYFVLTKLNNTYLRYFGKVAFYERMEMAISEIYMKCLIK